MSLRFKTCLIVLILAGLLAPSAIYAQAQTFGRILIIAKTPDGDPIPGVKITVTEPSLNTQIEKTTNKKGKATISVVDATKTYNFRFEYEGMNPLDTPIKPVIGSSITREIVLDPNSQGDPATMVSGEGEPPQRRFSPAEKAYNLGVEALRAGDRETAKAHILDARSKNDQLGPIHSALAGLYLEEGNYAEALASARTFQELEPESARGLRLVYEAHKGLGDTEAADAALSALMEKGGDDVAAMIYNEGVEALKVGDRRSAKARFMEALEMKPDLPAALSGLGIVLAENGEYAEAAKVAERLLAQDPKNKTGLRVAYDSYKNLGDKEKEDATFALLAEVDPVTVSEQLYNSGAEFFSNGDIDSAIDYFERSVQADPSRAKAHYQLGLCYVNKEQNAKAKEHLAKFVELAPDDPDAVAAKEMISFL